MFARVREGIAGKLRQAGEGNVGAQHAVPWKRMEAANMQKAKDEVPKLLSRLPDDCSSEDIQYHLDDVGSTPLIYPAHFHRGYVS